MILNFSKTKVSDGEGLCSLFSFGLLSIRNNDTLN